MATHPVRLNGVDLIAHISGALYWPARRVLLVADLHLEKGSSYGRSGQFLPPYDSRATLSALGQAIAAFDPAEVICLGDSFHDGEAAQRLSVEDRRTLMGLARGRRWLWLLGNHDPAPPAGIPGDTAQDVTLGALALRHEADPARPEGEISGHFHPKAAVRTRAGRRSARCFISDGRRMILPSFGAYTGGLCVTAPAIADLFGRGRAVLLLGKDKLHRFPFEALTPIR